MKFLILPALAALAFAAPAAAQPAGETTSIAVPARGLDLDRSADATRLAGRLERAALNVCGASEFSARAVQEDVRASACYRAALDHALATLNAPAVSAALSSRLPAGDR